MSAYRVGIAPRLFGADGKKCFGPGIARLMEGVDALHSIRRAAGEMGMAYSKAWSIINACEGALGFLLIEREAGGRAGGGSRLTRDGRALLERYRALERGLDEAAAALSRALLPHSD